MYLVTGATGNVGSGVVEGLLKKGHKVRVFTRDAEKVARWGDRVEVAIGDLSEPETFAKAGGGVEAVYLMNGALDGGVFRQLLNMVKAQGKTRIVFLSTLFAEDPDSLIGRLHKDKENALLDAGVDGKVIRAGWFMTNAFQWIGTIKAEGTVYNALGDGKTAVTAPEDIAAVTVEVLISPDSFGEIIEVTGGTLLSVPEQVSLLAQTMGKPIRCIQVPTEAAIQVLVRNGIPPRVAAAVGQSFESIRDGKAEQVSDTVKRVTGKQPRTFEAWAQAYAQRFA